MMWGELSTVWREQVQPALNELVVLFRENVTPELDKLTERINRDVKPAMADLTVFMQEYGIPAIKWFTNEWIRLAKIYVTDVFPVLVKVGGWIFTYIVEYVRMAITVVTGLIEGFKWLNRTAISVAVSISGAFKTAFNGIAYAWNNTVGKLSFTVPDIPGVPGRGQSYSMPRVPYLADGGIVDRATLAMIGEGREPEAVIPLSKLDEMLASKGASDESMKEIALRLDRLIEVSKERLKLQAVDGTALFQSSNNGQRFAAALGGL